VLATLEDHPHARAVLGGALPPGGSPSHAYLFHGPPGAGKRAAARAFAAALLSEGSSDPAGAAARVEHGTHPDLTWVVPTGATEMRVSDIDEPVVAAASHTPFESRRRVFVIEGAELMNDNAANRLLKTLEEPAPFAHIVLVTDRLSAVLPTIASRCQAVRFDTAAPEEIAARALRGAPPESALACARLSLGDAERARMLAFGDGAALRSEAEAFARAACAGVVRPAAGVAVLARAKALGAAAGSEVEEAVAGDADLLPRKERSRAKREGEERAKRAARGATTDALDAALTLVGLWLRDVACVRDGAPELVHAVDRLAQLEEDAATLEEHGVPTVRLRDGIAAIDDVRFGLRELNLTADLALDALAERLARLLRG